MLIQGERRVLEATPRREILRYMGLRGEPEAALEAMIQRCFREMLAAAEPRAAAETDPLREEGEDLLIGPCRIHSRDLRKNLRGCGSVVWMAVTLGPGTDRVIRRAGLLGAGEQLCCEAIGSAMAEAFCDEVNRRLKEAAAAEGLGCRPRFSPGFGDLDLEIQRAFLERLDMGRRLGIHLGESLLMSPAKSVTAFIGRYRPGEGE